MITKKFETIKEVYDFVAEMQKLPQEVYVAQGNYQVNGKSLMGLFSLDLAEPVEIYMGC